MSSTGCRLTEIVIEAENVSVEFIGNAIQSQVVVDGRSALVGCGQCEDCKAVANRMQVIGWQLVLNRLAFAVT
jgi:hypothetical protein